MNAKQLSIIFVALCQTALADTPSPDTEGHAVAGQPAAPQAAPAPFVKDPRYWPTPVMDTQRPVLPKLTRHPTVLIFSKTNGYRDDDQNKAAIAAVSELITQKKWDVFATENAATFDPKQLKKFDIIVLNSISGDVFLPEQREAFKNWIEAGGGVVALHGSGGDHHYDWQWYVDVLLGAQFIGHTYSPQFQPGVIHIVDNTHPAMRNLPNEWQRTEEWYAFDRVPTGFHTHILATLDENSYHPIPQQVMGTHPLIWTRCIGNGRVFFSALGHKAETYSEPLHLKMIAGALDWAALAHKTKCDVVK